MRKQEEKYLARVLVLSILLSGGTGVYLAPRAEAVADNTIRETTSTGSFTVDQDNPTRHGIAASQSSPRKYIVGITGELKPGSTSDYYGPFTVTMTDKSGDTGNTISVSDNQTGKAAYAMGIYSEGPADGITLKGDSNAVPIKLNVTATGGKDTENDSVNAYAYGVFTSGGSANTLGNNSNKADNIQINVTANGWKNTSNEQTLSKNASAHAYGLDSISTCFINDNSKITVNAYGGDATNNAYAEAYGFFNGKTIVGTESAKKDVEVTVGAKGGKTTSTYGEAHAVASGLNGDTTVNGNGTVTVEATGGTGSETDGNSYGINGNNTISGNGTVKVIATGGTASSTSANLAASAAAYGITGKNKIGGNGIVNVTAIGGTASSMSGYVTASASAFGIFGKNTISGNSIVNVTAIGGTASSTSGEGSTSASAFGGFAQNGTNTLGGDVDITVDASVKWAGEGFLAQSLCAMGEAGIPGTNDLTAPGKTKKIQGDVSAYSYGNNNVVLDTNGSYLQGNMVSASLGDDGSPNGVNNITISNGAVWRPVYDNRYGTDGVVNKYGQPVYDSKKNIKTNKVAERSTTYDTVVRHINLGSIRHFKLVENNIKQFTQHINLCFFCALF